MRYRLHILISILTLGAILTAWTSSVDAASFWKGSYFKRMTDKAEKLSQESFDDPSKKPIPPQLNAIGYDEWRDIRFRPDQALWKTRELPFQVQFFHMGFLFTWPVKISVVNNRGINTVAFTPNMFTYGPKGLKDIVPSDFSFAGFRVHHPINRPDYWDEVVAFLGASYFRAVAQNLAYGLSSRGLAVNTGTSSGEEFPFFKEFWLEQPKKNSETITIYALLDSPSITGAFEFVVKPGKETVMDVHMALFPRRNIEKLGLAPLTSMYFFGENQPPDNHKDFRPEVHDSDGLLIHTQNDEWIWRPLMNPTRLLINTFNGNDVKGFGLLQRDTNFDHYQDLEARSDIRPSAWVEPKGNWGKGHVELLQIPTTNEYNDNMNAFWVPEEPLKAGEKADYRYTLRWFQSTSQLVPLGHVTDTRLVWEKNNEIIMFVLEYMGEELNALPESTYIYPDISIAGGYSIQHRQMIKNKVTGGWRLTFRIERGQRDVFKDMIPSQKPAVDLRVVLNVDDKPLTETWIYSFLP